MQISFQFQSRKVNSPTKQPNLIIDHYDTSKDN